MLHVTLSTGMINYREYNATLRTASCKRHPIEGHRDLSLPFRSISGDTHMLLRDVRVYPASATIFFL